MEVRMADNVPNLCASPRTRTGKGAARQARREGNVPGVVYGGGLEPQPIKIKHNSLVKALKAGKFLSTLFNLKIDGQEEDARVICRGVQRDVVNDQPTHVDFMRLHRTSRINLFIPVSFINQSESPGLKQGGVLTAVRNEIELIVTAGSIPSDIPIDVQGMDIGDVVTVSMIDLPSGTRPRIADRDFVIANISAPSGLQSEEEQEDEVEEEEFEIEVEE